MDKTAVLAQNVLQSPEVAHRLEDLVGSGAFRSCALLCVVSLFGCAAVEADPAADARAEGSTEDALAGFVRGNEDARPPLGPSADGAPRPPLDAVLDAVVADARAADAALPDVGSPDAAPPPATEPPGPRPWDDFPAPVGFGGAATGGRGGAVCRVENLDARGAGSLRSCAEGDEPRWIVFDVSGRIALDEMIDVGSNKTIDGRGRNIAVTGRGLRISGRRNVIVHGVRIEDANRDNEDALQIISGSRDVWIDHVTVRAFTDGALDITRAATDVTVSWCHFADHDKVMLIGASPDHVEDVDIRVTLHHNFFEGTVQRHPRIRYAYVHAFNNYLRHWQSYGMASSQNARLLSERNVFEPRGNDLAIQARAGDDPDTGAVESRNDRALGGASIDENRTGEVENAPYRYTAEAADDALMRRVRAGAGAPR
jgi:pectate lyase